MNEIAICEEKLGIPSLIAAAGDQASRGASSNYSPPPSATGTRAGPMAAPAASSSPGAPTPECSELAAVQPLHVATWIEMQTRELAAPSVKQRLAAVRHLFDWLVIGQVVP